MNPIDLTWLSQVKSFAEVLSDKDDQIISDQITAFSKWVLTYCSASSLNTVQTYTEVRNGNGSPRMFVRNPPAQLLRSVIFGSATQPLSSGFGQAGIFIEQSQKSIAIRPGSGSSGSFISTSYPGWGCNGVFPKGIGNIQLVYDGGFPAQTQTNELETIALQTIPLDYPTWASDLGVLYYPSLTALTKVPSAPTTGQYAVANGIYVFSTGDDGKQVLVSYTYNAPAPDLEFACRRTVGVWYKRRGWLDQRSKSISASGATGTTTYRDWPLTPEDRITINSYKRYALTG